MYYSQGITKPICPIWRRRAADLGSSLSMFKKAADTEISYWIMYVCKVAEKNCDVLIIVSISSKTQW